MASLWKRGILATLLATIATTCGAALASQVGVSFADKTGASIPLPGFATLTVFFSIIGLVIASLVAWKAKRPRSTWVRTAVALVLLSFVPDLISGFDAISAITLMSLHVLAAVIVVPQVAKALPASR